VRKHSIRILSRVWHLLVPCLAICSFGSPAYADVVTFGGAITQSTADGTGPAINNPSLNAIQDGDSYSVTLNVNGSINSPGTYTNFTGAMFSDVAASASETSFGPISLTVSPDGSFDDISVLACLTTGMFGCGGGNQLDANFAIPDTALNSQNVAAQGIPFVFPSLDLLEDDGTTDIQGTITGYSYTSQSPVPEPSSLCLVVCLAAVFAAAVTLLRRKFSFLNP
jgi:hypothetical protein